MTFEQVRQQMREAREKAEKEAAEAQKEAKEQKPEKTEQAEPAKQLDVDFDVKETGQKKQLIGYDTREVVMTITVREKGKTLDESGGLVMTSDMWLAPQIPAMKEAGEFELRYWKQLQGGDTAGVSAEQMAAAIAMYPMLKPALDRMKQESGKLSGTPLLTVMTFEAVQSTEAMKNASSQGSSSGGGLERHAGAQDDQEGRSETARDDLHQPARGYSRSRPASHPPISRFPLDSRRRSSNRPGQVDGKRRSLPHFTRLDVDPAAAALHDPVHGCQPEAGALLLFLGGEERLEGARANLFAHSASLVVDREPNVVSRREAGPHLGAFRDRHVLGHDPDGAALGHRVPGVGGEIHQYLFDLPRVGANPVEIRLQHQPDLNVGRDQPGEQLVQPADHVVQVEIAWLQCLLAGKGQQLPRQGGRALGRTPDLLDVRAPRVGGRHLLEQQVGVAEDRSEHVVEVVGDTAGQPPDRFQLLRMPQPVLARAQGGLHRTLLGDVAMVDNDGADGGIAEAIDADRLAPVPLAVLVKIAKLDLQQFVRVREAVGEPFGDDRNIVGMEQLRYVLAQPLLGRVAGPPLTDALSYRIL